jgi:hypothetical protein
VLTYKSVGRIILRVSVRKNMRKLNRQAIVSLAVLLFISQLSLTLHAAAHSEAEQSDSQLCHARDDTSCALIASAQVFLTPTFVLDSAPSFELQALFSRFNSFFQSRAPPLSI